MPHGDGETKFSESVADCLARLRSGDPRAREAVVELCQTRLRVLVHRMLRRFPNVRRWDETDDICQDAATDLWRALDSLSLSEPVEVLRIAHTIVKRKLIDRARKYAGPLSDAANHATHDGTSDGRRRTFVEQVADDRSNGSLDRWSAFQEAIEALPPEEREVFHLVWFLQAKQSQIAELLGVSPSTVKRLWQRARATVRQATGGEPPETTTGH